ncbi:MAG: hypothetical protein ABIB43_05875 [archaeon]
MKADKKYYKKKFIGITGDCFRLSLANYFLEISDEAMAQQVYDDYLQHPYVGNNGQAGLAVATKIVSDLTNNKYFATAHVDDLDRKVKNISDPKNVAFAGHEKLKTMKEELDKGRYSKGFSNADAQPPYIIMESYLEFNHAALYLGENKYVNDGHLKRRNLEPTTMYGIINIEKNDN